MRNINLTSGQKSMQKIIVETTRTVAERLNVFRTSPFEFDVTAPAIAATEVVGRPTVIDNQPAAQTKQRGENWPAMLTTAPATRRG